MGENHRWWPMGVPSCRCISPTNQLIHPQSHWLGLEILGEIAWHTLGNWEREPATRQGGGGNRTGEQGSAGRREPGGQGASLRGAAAVAVRRKLRSTAAQGSRVGLGAGRRPANRRPATDARRPAGSRDGVPGSARLRLACRVSPPPRGRREETSREVRAARDFFFHAAYGGEQRGRSMSREAVAVALGLPRSQPSMDDPTAEVCRRRGPMICAIQGQVSSFRDTEK